MSDADAVLRDRWSRSRKYITTFSVFLPALQVLLCTAIVVLADGALASPAALPLIPVALAAVALRLWLRREAPLDPSTWLPAASLTAGVQLLSSAIPAYGIATTITAETQTLPIILFFLCLVVAVATCTCAHRAAKALLRPLVAELGSADLRLTLAVRVAAAWPEPVSAQIVIGRDRVEWTVCLVAGRRHGTWIDKSVPFRELLEVAPVTLPVVPDLRPWIILPGEITLYAPAGPAIVLTSVHDQWLIPVHDADLVAELVTRRRDLWSQSSG